MSRFSRAAPTCIGRVFLYSMLAMMIVAFIMTVLVDRTRLGFGLRCIRQNEDAADMVGIDVTSYKTAAFTLSAMFCGTVGAIYASWVAYIDPSDAFSILLTLKVPVMALLGGPGTVLGPVVGAVALRGARGDDLGAIPRATTARSSASSSSLLIFTLPGGLLRLQMPTWNWRALVAAARSRAGGADEHRGPRGPESVARIRRRAGRRRRELRAAAAARSSA